MQDDSSASVSLNVLDLLSSTFAVSGEIIVREGHFTEAAAYFQKTLALRPGHVVAIRGLCDAALRLASSLAEQNEPGAAECQLRKALCFDPAHRECRIGLAELLAACAPDLIAQGLRDEAESALREALHLHPGHKTARARLAADFGPQVAEDGEQTPIGPLWDATVALERAGELFATEAKLWHLLTLLPGQPDIVLVLMATLARQADRLMGSGDLCRAEGAARKALFVHPDGAGAQSVRSILTAILCLKAPALINEMRFAEAEAILWEAFSLRPDFAEIHNLLRSIASNPARTIVQVPAPRYTAIAEGVSALLEVKDVVGKTFVRVGKDRDGGYVMLDDNLENKTVYSLGIGDDVSWDTDMADRGCRLFQYDHTIDALPALHPGFHWSKIGICPVPGSDDRFKSLAELISLNGHRDMNDLILKMDIEGAEWPLLDKIEDHVLRQFSQIVGEFHSFATMINPASRALMVKALEKINGSFQLVHIHANNAGPTSMVGGHVVHHSLELTYVRRADHRFAPTARRFPTPLDRPCLAGVADLALG